MTNRIIQIKTDEDYADYLKHQEKYANNKIIIADFRPGKNTIACSLDFGWGRNNVSRLSDFIKDRVDNNYGIPDKIYITYTTEPYLQMMEEKLFSNVVEKGFYVPLSQGELPIPNNENIECIFISGDLAIISNVKEYLKVNAISTGNIKTYGFPFGLLSRTRKRLTELNTNNKIANYNSIPTKHFICVNASPLPERAKLITWLHETNIIDKCHWSWLRRGGTTGGSHHRLMEKLDGINTAIFDFRKTKELDMSLDELDTHINQDTVSDFYYLTDSLIDIGIESTPKHYQFITEKTWKPYLYGKVSLFFNCQSYYAILKNLGFELYDEIFDYSFDTIVDTSERQTEYHNELKRLSEIPIEELQKKILSIEDKIMRNRNHAWNCDLKTLPPFKEYSTLLP